MEIILNKDEGKHTFSLVIEENFFSNLLDNLNTMKNDVLKGEETYFESFTDTECSKEDSLNNIDMMIEYVLDIKENPDNLLSVFDNLPKKKNGTLYKNRNVVLAELNFCSNFYTDFTSAWEVPTLRVKSYEDKKCYLEFVPVQLTN